MKERPILFSDPMVRAILEGRKTQTRRVVKYTITGPNPPHQIFDWYDSRGRWVAAHGGAFAFSKTNAALLCPYGQPGDRIVVKEAAWMWCERVPNGKTAKGRDKWLYRPLRSAQVHYVADHPERPALDVVSPDTGNRWGWRYKVARFLPKWARRITLEIVSVRVERLNDISEADARAEGIDYDPGEGGVFHVHGLAGCCSDTAIGSYRKLWESINGASSCNANPWVWVVEFRRLER